MGVLFRVLTGTPAPSGSDTLLHAGPSPRAAEGDGRPAPNVSGV